MNNLAKINEVEVLINDISQLISHIKKNMSEPNNIEIDLLLHKFRMSYDSCLSIKYSVNEKVIPADKIEIVEKKLEYTEPVIEKILVNEPITPKIISEKEKLKIEIQKEEPIIQNIVQSQPEKFLKKENEIIADMFENKRSVNEKIATNKKDLATKFKDNPIKDINSAIGLNDKFLFIRELFDNNSDKFTSSIDKLNNFENLDQAMQYINTEFKWNNENPVSNKFLELIYRRYIS